MYQFVESTGYKLPNTEFLARWLLRERQSTKHRITKKEVDNAIMAIQARSVCLLQRAYLHSLADADDACARESRWLEERCACFLHFRLGEMRQTAVEIEC